MAEFEITRFERLTTTERTKGSYHIVAKFDCVCRGFKLESCALLRREGKGFQVWMPSRFVRLPSDLSGPLKVAAREIFQAMCST